MRNRHVAWLFALVVPACLVLTGCQSGGAGVPCGLMHVTDLPWQADDSRLYARIKINGKDVVLMFDTGAEDNLIALSTARALGMSVNTNGYDHVTGIGGEQEVGKARSDDVRIGDAHGTKLEFLTIRDSKARFNADGILGMNFLYSFDMDLDFWSGRLGLYKTVGKCAAPMTAMEQPLFSTELVEAPRIRDSFLPDSPAQDLSPGINVLLNGVSLRAEIDTGSFQTIIFRDSARRAGLVGDDIGGRIEITGAGPRVVKASIRKAARLEIGELTLEHVPVVVVDQRHLDGVDMLLGYDFVTKIHLWISRSSNTLIMQYPPKMTAAPPDTRP